MKKMPCLFVRKFEGRNWFEITTAVTPGCEWVLNGEGVPYWKWDGTACMVQGGKLYKRYDAKRGKTPPPGAIPCDEPDPVTGHHPHWILVGDEPESKWHKAAFEARGPNLDGTYELCGPHFQANPHDLPEDLFLRHTAESNRVLDKFDRSFENLRDLLALCVYEGVVFHHADGRMCKIRRSDFGFTWPIPRHAEEA